MKKIVALTLVLLMLLTASSALAEKMIVHITALCYDTNHLGTRWAGSFRMGDVELMDGMILDLVPAQYEFYTEIGEYDSSPEVGYADDMYNVTKNRLQNGFTVEQYLTVTENKGIYKGYWCEWYVYLTFSPVGNATVLH